MDDRIIWLEEHLAKDKESLAKLIKFLLVTSKLV